MKRPIVQALLTAIVFGFHACPTMADEASLSLTGAWKFKLDAGNVGIAEKWYGRTLEDTVQLPGSTDENRKGVEKNERPTDRLMRPWFWKGPAWYQRKVNIPDAWKGKRITLFLERTKNTRVWVDQTFCGGDDTLSAPQVFNVTKVITPGEHTLTVLVDNSKLPPVGPAHAVDERTQTNWNGIIGKMELRATDPVWLEDVQVYPNAAKKEARVHAVIGNITGKPITGSITVACESFNVATPKAFKTQTVELHAKDRENAIEFTYTPGEDVPLWNEFQPTMLRLNLQLESKAGDATYANSRSASFGMRDFTREGTRLQINGHPISLRGRLDCANYPLTGYPPMDKAGWLKIMSILKQWGLNHVRFHSWCPPEAAFEAADELGFYFQVELPNKRSAFNAPDSKEAAIRNIDFVEGEGMDKNVSLYDYGKREGELIFKNFGNHPSFVLFTLGNELGSNPGMFELVKYFKETDPRHLYAQGSNNNHWNPSLAEGDDFWVTGKVAKDSLPIRGSFSLFDFPNSPIESMPPSTMFDFSESLKGVPVPLISHEVGEYQVYPDFRDIPKFTGVTRARNYEIFRERLEKAGMLDQAPDFVRASGTLAAICYREDIEMSLRTPHIGGFQLLDIQDFTGQGTALVGMLNDFMESKGIIDPAAWRQFCCETVPLLRMEKYTWTTDETFHGKIQVAHHGAANLADARVTVTVHDPENPKDANIASMTFPPTTIQQGEISEIGTYSLPLKSAGINAPRKLEVHITIEGTPYANTYPIWVYPPKAGTAAPAGVMIVSSFRDEKTQKHLASGGKVLLLPKLDQLPLSVPGGFETDYWSPMFAEAAAKRGGPQIPGTLGILCDPSSPALADFPTEFHSNWQWWHLVKNSRPIILDETPANYRPIVQVIDNFARNHKLGLIAETKVGKGTMLVCAVDLLGQQNKPEARQLLHSLLQYMVSPTFAPKAELNTALLEKLFPN